MERAIKYFVVIQICNVLFFKPNRLGKAMSQFFLKQSKLDFFFCQLKHLIKYSPLLVIQWVKVENLNL